LVGQGKIEAVALLEPDHPARARVGGLLRLGLVEHRLAEIHTKELGALREAPLEGENHVAAAGRQV
jgi:hypothetical protein